MLYTYFLFEIGRLRSSKHNQKDSKKKIFDSGTHICFSTNCILLAYFLFKIGRLCSCLQANFLMNMYFVSILALHILIAFILRSNVSSDYWWLRQLSWKFFSFYFDCVQQTYFYFDFFISIAPTLIFSFSFNYLMIMSVVCSFFFPCFILVFANFFHVAPCSHLGSGNSWIFFH